ncbi:MAG: hypothetical protein IPL61_37940 [Myxococcales bacterium]|nr:hypothetical protein [Myxococcales bacterium]
MKLQTLIPVMTLAVACGGKSKPAVVAQPAPVVVAKPPPPPPPVCVPATEPARIVTPASTGTEVQFCTSDDAGDPSCFEVGLADGKFAKLAEAPAEQHAALEVAKATVQTTPTTIEVCVAVDGGDSCATLKPKVGRGASEPIRAVANVAGTTVVALVGDAEAGKGTLEVWDVGKKKKTATIKYAKGDYKCGDVAMLGDTIYVSASVCAGPDARGALYTLKGKKLADVGGRDFGTYGTSAVQIEGDQWAFLEEGAGTVAIQDVATGAVAKTIDLLALWAGGDASDGTRANGNPGESALVRGGPGELVVVAGSPAGGNIAVITTDTGELKVWKALPCAATEPPEPTEPTEDATGE